MRTIGPVDWAIILWSLVGQDLLMGVVGLKPMVPTGGSYFRVSTLTPYIYIYIYIYIDTHTRISLIWSHLNFLFIFFYLWTTTLDQF